LPGPVGAEEAGHPAGLDRETDAVDRHLLAIAFGQVLHFDHGITSRRIPTLRGGHMAAHRPAVLHPRRAPVPRSTWAADRGGERAGASLAGVGHARVRWGALRRRLLPRRSRPVPMAELRAGARPSG